MVKNEFESARKIKSNNVKEKIIEASTKLINNYGYEYVTVRNICKMANVSNGTFYHHFKNKDELMSYYILRGYDIFKTKNMREWEEQSAQYRAINLLTWFATYFSELGMEFVSSYYSTKNQALNVRNPSGTEIHFEIVNKIVSQLEAAQNEGMISNDRDVKNIYNELNIIFFGNVFDWCLCNCCFDLAKQVNKMIKIHLNYYLADKYKMPIE
jgi:AcrR family transcriptional regulator